MRAKRKTPGAKWLKSRTGHKSKAMGMLQPNHSTDNAGEAERPAREREADDLTRTGPTNGKPRATPAVDPWPDPPAREAFHGIAGELVDLIDPYTEADRVAFLIQFLGAFGNLIGKRAHFRFEADHHSAKLDAVLVGTTSKGRKGTSWRRVAQVFRRVDEKWSTSRIVSGLSSGEGLIWEVRDPIYKGEKEIDPGVDDKRLLVVEEEFSSVLKVAQREKNTISAIIRQAWDSDTLRTITKNSPAQSSGCHISIFGHITRDELRRTVTETDMANGLCNRFLWVCVKRSKCLPDPMVLEDSALQPYIARLIEAADFAKEAVELRRDAEAGEIWKSVYPSLSDGKPGLLGAVTSRAEAQVMRLALIFALLDQAEAIGACHLNAAIALWDYCEASARYIFGSRLGDPVADEIRDVLKSHPDGMSRTDLSAHFNRNRSSQQIGAALRMLTDSGMARMVPRADTGGRPEERWFAM